LFLCARHILTPAATQQQQPQQEQQQQQQQQQQLSSPPSPSQSSDRVGAVSASTTPVVAEEERAVGTEHKVDRPLSWRRIPCQFDGIEDDVQFVQEENDSGEILRYENSSDDLSSPRTIHFPHLLSIRAWADTALHILLRRQQQEAEHLSARHFMEIVALREEREIAMRNADNALSRQAHFPFCRRRNADVLLVSHTPAADVRREETRE
jgi:hypothetical protein